MSEEVEFTPAPDPELPETAEIAAEIPVASTTAPATAPNQKKIAWNQYLIIGLVFLIVVLLVFVFVHFTILSKYSRTAMSTEFEDLRKMATEAGTRPQPATPSPAPQPTVAESLARQNAATLSNRIIADSEGLVEVVAQMEAQLISLEQELKGVKALYGAAATQAEQLKEALESNRQLKITVQQLRTELSQTHELLIAAGKHIETLKLELAGAPDPRTVTERDAYARQIQELQAQIRSTGMLQAENDELRYEVQRLRAELNRARLFVDKADDLPPAAKALYVELSKLETVGPTELKENYARIERELGASVRAVISFETGKSVLPPETVAEITSKPNEAPADSYFLVVGYASKTGTFDLNKKLSSDRATTIASVADRIKKPGQRVNAVFFGQTDRFSASDVYKNQICEVWEIKTL